MECGGGSCGIGIQIVLDVRGASNTPCTLTLEQKGHTKSFDIGAPSPSVSDTSLAPRAPIMDTNACGSDAGAVSLTPPSTGNGAYRTSTDLCVRFYGYELYGELGSDCGDGNVLFTLTCGGAVLYDRVPHLGCRCYG
jgi:hypothetical protein